MSLFVFLKFVVLSNFVQQSALLASNTTTPATVPTTGMRAESLPLFTRGTVVHLKFFFFLLLPKSNVLFAIQRCLFGMFH
jgi:hypothetical protein